MKLSGVVLILLSLATTASAAPPHAEWRTTRSEHYRVHYPVELEAWALRAASRLESARDLVEPVIGWEDESVVDVLVIDPMASANGMALPFLNRPRMILWTNPPPGSSMIGFYEDWMELLIIHEQVHLTHLLRPSRNPWTRLRSLYLQLGPITSKAPRWAIEGYATVLEGRLTGSGRPQGDGRAAILRQWALEGKLPSYGRLASDSQSWMGMSMAYLVGSAYLEWLERRSGEESLRNLWARLTARQERSFAVAFEGVFGDSPADLYDRFAAELTYDALALERLIPEPVDGDLWQDLSWSTGRPAVSPDGELLAVVLRGRERPDRLVVWEIEDDGESQSKYEERISEMLERDPTDVAPVRVKPLAREPKYVLAAPLVGGLRTPSWTREGELLYVTYEPDVDGFLSPQVWRWNPESGRNERLPATDDLRSPASAPGGFVAIRNRAGHSELVRWRNGEIESLAGPSLTSSFADPAVAPDGSRVVFTQHVDGRWELRSLDLGSGELETLDRPAGATILSTPAFSPDGEEIYATAGTDGFLDIWRWRGESPAERVTLSWGGSLAPALGADGSMFFLSIDSDGRDLRRISTDALEPIEIDLGGIAESAGIDGFTGTKETITSSLARPDRSEPASLEVRPTSGSKPYGAGRQEPFFVTGGGRYASAESIEAGVQFGDVVGRLGTTLVGSISSGGPEGGALSSEWRGWPVTLGARLYSFERDLDEQPAASLESSFPIERTGVELTASRRWIRGSGSDRILLGSGYEEVTRDRNDQDEVRVFGSATIGRAMRIGTGDSSVRGGFRLEAMHLDGDTEETTISGAALWGALDLGVKIRGGIGYRRATDDRAVLDVGGIDSSLQPHSDSVRRWAEPALPLGLASGSELEAFWIELPASLSPFYRGYRLDGGDWIELAGLTLDLELEAQPLIGTPALELSIGAAWVFDELLEDDLQWWIGARWR